MNKDVFAKLQIAIKRESGISLTENKMELLENRLLKRLRALSIRDANDYISYLEMDTSGFEMSNLIDAVSTNVTFFFREESHFQKLDSYLGELIKRNQKVIKIWCAAASSGEEPYTIAMTAAERIRGTNVQVKILATDICMPVLQLAHRGVYTAEQLEKVPEQLIKRYFTRSSTDRTRLEVTPALKDMVVFKKLNLASLPFPLSGPVDSIFCRNVMIYFERSLREQIVAQFVRLLSPNGLLFLSHSENLLGVSHSLTPLGESTFRRGDLPAEMRA